MSRYDFIVDDIRFSYSSLSTYDNCPYCFKLTYIDALPRQNNFYAEYGTMIHECFEQYFTGNLEDFQLSQYYLENYKKVVKTPSPVFPAGMEDRYKAQGQDFFDTFSFDKTNLEILVVEDKIDFDLDKNSKFVAKPDLVAKNKDTGLITLYDYKTAIPFKVNKKTGTEIADKKKIDGYYKQMLIYSYVLRKYRSWPIHDISLWYTRMNRIVTIPWKEEEEEKVFVWVNDVISRIKSDEKFCYNNTSEYFCNNLCSVRNSCKFR